jgi:uncharacterized membrane protein YgcG
VGWFPWSKLGRYQNRLGPQELVAQATLQRSGPADSPCGLAKPGNLRFSAEEYKRGSCGGRLGLTLTIHHSGSAVAPFVDPLTLLLSPALMASPLSDLLLLLLVTSSGIEPYPLLLLPRRRSPFSIDAAQRLGLAVESQDLSARLLPVEAVKWANCRSTRLSHGLNRSGGVPGSNGSVSFDGGASGGGTARDSVGEVGGGP